MSHLRPGTEIGSFILEKEIGSGAFASVWRGHHKISNSVVAIKTITKASLETEVAKTRLVREIALLKSMDHPFISEFFSCIEDSDYYFVVMEYVENGNLLDYVNNNGRLSEDQARRYFGQLVSCLDYLHFVKKVAHRDLKCENILLDTHNNIKLIDFGLSNAFTDFQPQLKTACGSPAYAAPEMIKGNPYTHSADVWSAGILLYAVVAGNLPFDDENIQRLLQKIVYTEVFYPSYLSPQLVDLLKKMICKDPEARITIDKIKEHPWFSQTEYLSLLDEMIFETSREGMPEIDRDIIQEMNELGVDTKYLSQSLLTGDTNDETVLYRILNRFKLTERMKDIKTKRNNAIFTKPGRLQTMPMMRPPIQKNILGVTAIMNNGIKKPTFMMKPAFGVKMSQQPGSASGNGGPSVTMGIPNAQRILAPGKIQIEARRMSRPVAFKKPSMTNAAPNSVISHEM
ncbi:CAMK family protein kinase [Tritrichomonas foetus]|uniref:non-specific serine/threonine protein kinase n=1 Tax=Tritrichomonas foetus TaxID=1144522 RepID=A0A1J4JJ90_9EUKA|nr:CAMK family protein kinase [Tritrichomonas foetus]|eukprot:OHS97300.1 CAMK family protein kinase [Tritrichomonas foetus]